MRGRSIRSHSTDSTLIEERRNYIADRSIKVLAKKGYARTTMEDLLRACKMGAGTMYHYIGTKADIIYLCVERAIIGTNNNIELIKRETKDLNKDEALRKAINLFYTIVDDGSDWFLFLNRELIYLEKKEQTMLLKAAEGEFDLFESLIKAYVKEHKCNFKNTWLLAHYIVAIGHAWATRRWILSKKTNLEEYIEGAIQLIFDILRQNNTEDAETKLAIHE
jgi:AcrR family transcriptional regulator